MLARRWLLRQSLRCRHIPRIYIRKYSQSHDSNLYRVFDEYGYWKDFSAPSRSQPTGLFDNPYISGAQGILKYTEDSLYDAKALVDRIVNAENEDVRNIIVNLDRLSDVLCRVIDMVGFVRLSHPDLEFVQAAQQSHEIMFEYMNILNTSVGLYQQLDRVLNSTVKHQLSREELVVGHILLTDFVRSGVTLDPDTRQKFIELATQVSIIGQRFLTETRPVQDYVTFGKDQVYGLDPGVANELSSSRFSNKVRIPTSGPLTHIAKQTIIDPQIRKEIWLAERTATDQQQDNLKSFLSHRAQLAQMMGYTSFGKYELQEKMIKSPENVLKFLTRLHESIHPLARKEIDSLAELKRNDKNVTKDKNMLYAWDKDYYSIKFLQSKRSRTYAPDSLSSYFSLGTVMQGLSRLFKQIYGIEFAATPTKPGEVWSDDVRRLDVVSETEGRIGIIYCDLFEREGKSPNPAHFTITCSREIGLDEEKESKSYYGSSFTSMRNGGVKYQLPVIALVCNFVETWISQNKSKCLLTFGEVETLFHEMGHAIHSMLGRTKLHNVSGTRCMTDFVELPSVLMENFASSPEILALYARHHETQEPLPYSLLKAYLYNRSLFKYSDLSHQIKLSLLDQYMHDSRALQNAFDPHQIYYELESKFGLFEPHIESQWHTYFGHLFGYGATYYCYLFDRAIADRIWSKLFSNNPLNRDAGEKFREEVLAWGGSRDPWQCVAGVLDEPDLNSGDEHAILQIGQSLKLD